MTTPTDVTARIDQLWIYPVKSCAGLSLAEAELTETGLAYDRSWMVVDADGAVLAVGRIHQLADGWCQVRYMAVAEAALDTQDFKKARAKAEAEYLA